jgi:type IV secretion system protein TrbL
VLVLAVITGIGSILFAQFTAGFGGAQPEVDDAKAVVLAALSLLALGNFGPDIANGLVSGGPQLSAGAAVGAGLAAGGLSSLRRSGGTRRGICRRCDGRWRPGRSRARGRCDGRLSRGRRLGVVMSGVSQTTAAMTSPLRGAAAGVRSSFVAGSRAVTGEAAADGATSSAGAAAAGGVPDWARRMKRSQTIGHGASAVVHSVKSGGSGGAGSSVNLSEGEKWYSGGHQSVTGAHSNRKRRTRKPRRSGTSGSVRVQARNGRLMAFGSLSLSFYLAVGLVWQSARGTVVPWVVQVDW